MVCTSLPFFSFQRFYHLCKQLNQNLHKKKRKKKKNLGFMLWDWSYCRIWNDSTMGTAKQRPRALNSSRPNPQPFPLGTDQGCRRPTGVWTAQKNYQDCTSPSGTDWCIWSYAYHVGSETYTRKTIFQALKRLWSGATQRKRPAWRVWFRPRFAHNVSLLFQRRKSFIWF